MSDVITLSDLLGDDGFVETARGRLEVRGLGVGEILKLITKYPVLASSDGSVSISVPALLDVAPDAVPEIIAIACGSPGKAGERAVRTLAACDQAKILHFVIERSLPGGPGPFVEQVAKLLRALREA